LHEEELGSSHLGIEEANGSLDNVDKVIVDFDLVDVVGRAGDDTNQLQPDFLGLHVEDEGVRKRRLLAGWDHGLISDGSEVADDVAGSRSIRSDLGRRSQLTADKGKGNGLGLMVGNVYDSLGGSAVDELHTKDVGFGESTNDISLELGSSRGAARILVQRLPIKVSSMCYA
jgi:hypothetical protein